jgi:hypothetical protein
MADSRAAQAAGTAGLFLALSWIFVLLRCYCRIAIVRRFGPEDYLCIITQVTLLVLDSYDSELTQPRCSFRCTAHLFWSVSTTALAGISSISYHYRMPLLPLRYLLNLKAFFKSLLRAYSGGGSVSYSTAYPV